MVTAQMSAAKKRDYTKAKEWQAVPDETKLAIVNTVGYALLTDNHAVLTLQSIENAKFTPPHGLNVDLLLLDHEERTRTEDKANYERQSKERILKHLGYRPMGAVHDPVMDKKLFQPQFFAYNMIKNKGDIAILTKEELGDVKDKFDIIYKAALQEAKKVINVLEKQQKTFSLQHEAQNAFDALAQEHLDSKTGRKKG